ncbi:hypothetical protein BDZ45DRAFT_426987 [Acephala macrosclerotiorum]|nr:hypothetical protein BDZ45DRAFT_426987 [Acephala macrosclerotiorum]
MLEYFAYKKIKKSNQDRHKHGRASTPSTPEPAPLLNEEDENFLTRVVSAEGTPPPLPDRPLGWIPAEAGDSTGNDAQMVVHDGNGTITQENGKAKQDKGKGKENEKAEDKTKKHSRFSFLTRSGTKKNKDKTGLHPDSTVVTPNEATKEEDDINKILEDLNLSAVNNRAFSLSKESQQLVQQFTVILKDLVNGVPTAYDDLTHLLDNSQGQLAKSYEHLPSFLQKLITQLPDKLTKNLAPELLAVAAEAQALNGSGAAAASAGGATSFGAAAKSFLKPTSLKDLVAKPGAVVSMLKAILNALKLRWPAFMGTNVLLSLALFVLLFVFWYCHKRGREVRLEREGKVTTTDSEGRIVELEDDPMLPEGRSTQTGLSRFQTDRPSPSRRESRRDERDRSPYDGSRPNSQRSRESRRSRDSRRKPVHSENNAKAEKSAERVRR